MTPKEILTYVGGGGFCLSLLVLVVTFVRPSHPLMEEGAGGIFTVSDGTAKNEARYSIQSPATLSGRVLMSDDQDPSYLYLGASAAISYLSEAEYDIVLRQFKSLRKCPASFYNQHHKFYLLIGRTDEVGRRLRKMTAIESDQFKIQGSLLQIQSLKVQGGTADVSALPAQYFLVDDFEVIPSPNRPFLATLRNLF